MIDTNDLKRIPYGVADFNDFRASNYYYIKPQAKKKTLPPGKIKTLKAEAESQLERYSPDEKFQKAIGQTTLKKLVLIFCGSRMVYHGDVAAAVGDRSGIITDF